MARQPGEWHWRDTMRPARFFMFDARAAMVVLFVLIYPRTITLIVFIVIMLMFYVLERMGLTFEAALRKFRAWLCGNRRPAHIWTFKRRWMDLGAE